MCGCMLIQGTIAIFAWERWIVGINIEIIVTAEFYEVSFRFVLYGQNTKQRPLTFRQICPNNVEEKEIRIIHINCIVFLGNICRTASVVSWLEFLATDPEVLGSIPGATRFSDK
jgi:hypothetical protein